MNNHATERGHHLHAQADLTLPALVHGSVDASGMYRS